MKIKMKKFLVLFLTVVLLLLTPFSVYAQSNTDTVVNEDTYIEYFEDGSYIVTEIISNEIQSRATGVVKTKSEHYYNSNNEKEWTVTVTGTFNYDGKTATCTKSVTSYKIYNDSWKVTASNASKSGAKATGTFTVKKYWLGIPTKTVNQTVTLTCSKNGNFS